LLFTFAFDFAAIVGVAALVPFRVDDDGGGEDRGVVEGELSLLPSSTSTSASSLSLMPLVAFADDLRPLLRLVDTGVAAAFLAMLCLVDIEGAGDDGFVVAALTVSVAALQFVSLLIISSRYLSLRQQLHWPSSPQPRRQQQQQQQQQQQASKDENRQ